MIRAINRRLLAAVVLLTVATGCNQPFDADSADLNGVWTIYFGPAASEFQFELEERQGGSIGGFWSYPDQFSYHGVEGQRTGGSVYLNAQSPNLFPVTLHLDFVGSDRLEGDFYFAGVTQRVTLRQGSFWP